MRQRKRVRERSFSVLLVAGSLTLFYARLGLEKGDYSGISIDWFSEIPTAFRRCD
jgi:hypothetical protein